MTTQTNFSTLNTEGIDLTLVFTSATSTPEYPAPPMAVGTTTLGANDSKWIYVTAAAAVTVGDVVAVNKSFAATSITNTTAATNFGNQLAVAAVCSTNPVTGQYFWAQTQGVCPAISVTASIAANVALYTTATAGRLGALATGVSYTVSGITTTTTSASTAGAYPGVITNLALGAAN